MIIDIGGGTTDIAVLSLGSIVTSTSIKVAGNTFDNEIIKYIKDNYKLLIGERTAEDIKKEIGSVGKTKKKQKMEVKGRSMINGLPETITITSEEIRGKYEYLLEGVNKALLLAGMEVTKAGNLVEVIQAKTLDEVDRRVNSLKKQLYNRAIHSEVQKYCIDDYLRKDYYDAVFEAAKGLAERVRQITGLTTDGGTLFQTAFSKNDPYLFFNELKTDSEKSEFTGLKELLEAIFHLVRNPAAHTPKVNWKVDETKALDILTLISFAHKYLDMCHKMPGKP